MSKDDTCSHLNTVGFMDTKAREVKYTCINCGTKGSQTDLWGPPVEGEAVVWGNHHFKLRTRAEFIKAWNERAKNYSHVPLLPEGEPSKSDQPIRACDPPMLAVLVEGVGRIEIPFSTTNRLWYVAVSKGQAWLSERPTDDAIGKVKVLHNSAAIHPSQVTHL